MTMIDKARDYAGLRKLIDSRRRELGLKMLDVDCDAGLQDGYFAKLICGARNFGDMSLGAVLTALDADLCLIQRVVEERRKGNADGSQRRERQ